MEKMHTSLEEQESTINLYPKSQGNSEFYSCEPALMKRVKKWAEMYPEEFIIEKEDEIGIFANAPRDWFSIRPPRRLTMSPEQRAAASERMKKRWESAEGKE